MTTLTLIDSDPGHARTDLTPHEQVGFELGWDYAHHRVAPPAPYADGPSALRNGLMAGRAAFGVRTLAATPYVRKWLQLRLHAWLRGRSVELVQVTPNYLRQIDAGHCPITRIALSRARLAPSDASVDRVRNDAGYAAGNLAVMSTKANHAKAGHGLRDAQRFAAQVDAQALPGLGGLTGVQWARVATLCSFVEPLSHDEACAIPMHVLPPNRLRLFNPVQALQAFVCRQLLVPGWARRLSRFAALLPGKPAQRDFRAFVIALLPRVLEAGRTDDASQARWAVEDAWRSATVQQAWIRFARPLGAAACERVLARAAARRLGTGRIVALPEAAATDGWQLASRGYVPHREAARPAPAVDAGAQRELGW